MGKALYRKYRSRTLDEVVGQEHITKTLARALKSGKISHAYLFTGPRGVGKTSVARILAHEVNGLPYTNDSMHLDIIEIDAASNRRIDEIRELRDKVHITPAVAKYKVYIIDEVHMLTREAFNALLKTLEEPPAHAIFILATTEAHKLPETIVSRTQRFTFKPVETQAVAEHLGQIAKKEKIAISKEALQLLAAHGQGSFRDSISLLDQLSNSQEKISESSVRNLLGLPQSSAVSELADSIKNGQPAELLGALESLFGQGVNAAAIARELSGTLRADLIKGQAQPWVAPLLKELLNVGASTAPADFLEISLLDAMPKNAQSEPFQPKTSKQQNTVKSSTSSLKIEAPTDVVEESTKEDFDMSYWPQVVEHAKSHAASLYTVLKLAIPEFSDGTLALNFEFPLHQKKLSASAQKDMVGQIIEQLTGSKVKIDCVVNKELFKNQPRTEIPAKTEQPKEADSVPVKSISNIFGNVEMLS